ncbi:protein EcsB [Sporosarcina sp. NCCP-2222]|uniref:ABC transporter permease n=1 Tax=Sporosarcina sp. NCCP-2222 TaxID=2935073 RepID=UPI0020838BE1|nr:ABC transporter permease [Sporosarcina sp. NCCP-2222]GKV57067.1 protein EcsB [Sporosarcina sp. NCCP-2222]
MKDVRNIWSDRFIHYMNEVQRYMKFVFTGHLAIVLVFTIGAGGYAYSNWLKEVPENFPAALLASLLIALPLAMSAPVTLLKPADVVFFLPLESQLDHYMKRSLRWTFFSQLPIPLLLFIVAMPLLSATHTGGTASYAAAAVFIVLLKWLFAETEYSFHHARSGHAIWIDRLIRYVLAFAILYSGLVGMPYVLIGAGLVAALYDVYWRKERKEKPFPYEHFIKMEQNRMMRFYRFANYFTDVPHLKGSVSRRRWLGPILSNPVFGKTKPQAFLVKRTLVRTDDIFWLWVRLTVLSVLGVLFIPFLIGAYIFTGALAFATALQLYNALKMGDDFRMDMLFPESDKERSQALRTTVRNAQWLQALVVVAGAFFMFGLSVQPILIGLVVMLISEATIRSASKEA